MRKKGSPAITSDLREFIEGEFKKYGYVDNLGKRCISLAPNLRLIAVILGVSEGTVKNGLNALRQSGYIEAQHQNLYLVLESTDSQSLKGPEYRDEDDLAIVDAEVRRLGREEVTAVLRDLIITCGIEVADRYIDMHRAWCVRNGLTPHI